MTEPRIVRLYLDDGLRASVASGQHGFFAKIRHVLTTSGFRVDLRPDDAGERHKARGRRGYALYHMVDPGHPTGLTVRRVYHYPFWAIEPVAERWRWRVAVSAFDPTDRQDDADRFFRFWRRRLFDDPPDTSLSRGLIYVPLQGRLQVHRRFQSTSPIDMLRAVLDRRDGRRVMATLHPKEAYSTADLDCLAQLQKSHPSLSVDRGNMEAHLPACDLIVTQNSSAAFAGYFFRKPVVLFARSDFHHIAANVHDLGIDAAFEAASRAAPDHAGYIHWFWQRMSINAGRPDATDQIAAALRRGGWPV